MRGSSRKKIGPIQFVSKMKSVPDLVSKIAMKRNWDVGAAASLALAGGALPASSDFRSWRYDFWSLEQNKSDTSCLQWDGWYRGTHTILAATCLKCPVSPNKRAFVFLKTERVSDISKTLKLEVLSCKQGHGRFWFNKTILSVLKEVFQVNIILLFIFSKAEVELGT